MVAYDLYVQAKNLSAASVFSSREKESLALVVNLLQQAIARDPIFFLAYYELALAHDKAYIVGVDHTPARLALAEKAVETAHRLRPNSGEAHLANAYHLYCAYLDYDHARAELALARQLLPNESFVFELAGYIARNGIHCEMTPDLRISLLRSRQKPRGKRIKTLWHTRLCRETRIERDLANLVSPVRPACARLGQAHKIREDSGEISFDGLMQPDMFCFPR